MSEEKLHNNNTGAGASADSLDAEPVDERSPDPDDLAREFEAREAALAAALEADDGGDALGYSHWSDIPKAPKPSRLREDTSPQVTEELLDYYKEKVARRSGEADADEEPRTDTARPEGEGDPSAPLRSAQDADEEPRTDTARPEGEGDPSTPLRSAQDDAAAAPDAPVIRHSEEAAADEESPAETDREDREGDPSTRAEALAQDDVPAPPAGPDYVAMTLSAGIAPLEMRFAQINSCYRRLPIAYRSFTYINSVLEGVIPPEKYSYAAEAGEEGERLARWSITKAIEAVRALEAAGRHVEFVTARCPVSLTREFDLYAWMKQLLASKRFDAPSKLCLEFPRSILYEDPERTRLALLSLKLLKVRTLMAGCGERDCPDTALLELPFDMVMLSPRMSALADNRDKSQVFNAYVGYLRSLPVEVIGDGLYNDGQISAHSRADCFGYTPSAGYAGAVEHGRLRMTLEEAVSQKEDDV